MMLFWSLFLISISAFCIFSTNAVSQESNLEKPRERVILSHDGGADDFVAQILLMTTDIELAGIIVTNADCFKAPALNVTAKISALLGKSGFPIAGSSVRGINPFPEAWRWTANIYDHYPILNSMPQNVAKFQETGGEQLMVDLIKASPFKTTILELGPMSTIAAALKIDPSIAEKIEKIVWMGGGFGNGNVAVSYESDGTAEWNVFWQPHDAHFVFHNSSIPIQMAPLDISNSVPLLPHSPYLQSLAKQRQHLASELAGLIYAPSVIWSGYYFWDVLATASFLNPNLFLTSVKNVTILTEGRRQGATIIDNVHGRPVTIVEFVSAESFHSYILNQFTKI